MHRLSQRSVSAALRSPAYCYRIAAAAPASSSTIISVSAEGSDKNNTRWYSAITGGKCNTARHSTQLNFRNDLFLGTPYESTAARSDSGNPAPPPLLRFFSSRIEDLGDNNEEKEKVTSAALVSSGSSGSRGSSRYTVKTSRRIKCLQLLKTKRGCRLLLKKSSFLKQLRSYTQEEDVKRTGSEKVCLGSSLAEQNRMKRNLYYFKSLFLWNEKNRNLPTPTRSPIVYNSYLYKDSNSTYCSGFPYQFTAKRRIKKIELPTHYLEANYKTLKAVVFYGPNIAHIPHGIRVNHPNLPLGTGMGRGQNI